MVKSKTVLFKVAPFWTKKTQLTFKLFQMVISHTFRSQCSKVTLIFFSKVILKKPICSHFFWRQKRKETKTNIRSSSKLVPKLQHFLKKHISKFWNVQETFFDPPALHDDLCHFPEWNTSKIKNKNTKRQIFESTWSSLDSGFLYRQNILIPTNIAALVDYTLMYTSTKIENAHRDIFKPNKPLRLWMSWALLTPKPGEINKPSLPPYVAK